MARNHNKLNYKGIVFRNGDAIPKTTYIDDFINKGKEQKPGLSPGGGEEPYKFKKLKKKTTVFT